MIQGLRALPKTFLRLPCQNLTLRLVRTRLGGPYLIRWGLFYRSTVGRFSELGWLTAVSLRVQVPNYKVSIQNHNYGFLYKDPIARHFLDP